MTKGGVNDDRIVSFEGLRKPMKSIIAVVSYVAVSISIYLNGSCSAYSLKNT